MKPKKESGCKQQEFDSIFCSLSLNVQECLSLRGVELRSNLNKTSRDCRTTFAMTVVYKRDSHIMFVMIICCSKGLSCFYNNNKKPTKKADISACLPMLLLSSFISQQAPYRQGLFPLWEVLPLCRGLLSGKRLQCRQAQ